MIAPTRTVADRRAQLRVVSDNPAPAWVQEPVRDEGNPARGMAVAAVLSIPMWWGLYCVGAWAYAVMGGRP